MRSSILELWINHHSVKHQNKHPLEKNYQKNIDKKQAKFQANRSYECLPSLCEHERNMPLLSDISNRNCPNRSHVERDWNSQNPTLPKM